MAMDIKKLMEQLSPGERETLRGIDQQIEAAELRIGYIREEQRTKLQDHEKEKAEMRRRHAQEIAEIEGRLQESQREITGREALRNNILKKHLPSENPSAHPAQKHS